MLKLKDVSKFYYNKGIISSGFTKVNAEFKLGEFVVITGESGSGKSTLLNVLSGIDSYEEGEMYINSEETSHYLEAQSENYRKKYIGNIFQNFNLVNSYTVYQNVELVLLINGYKKKEIKNKVLSILKEVGLYRFRKTKVAKLSGGQKQRVAIARALAKESPIIVADEPTGNLDSRSAANVLETLYKISKNKLVIIVTHNYEQVEKYVTRKIKMHDGKIVEDKLIKKTLNDISLVTSQYQNMSLLYKVKLGLRNTFNIMPKFLLIALVYLFMASALLSQYSGFKKLEYEENKIGYNNYFKNTDDKRIIIQKNDKSVISEDEYAQINNLDNIDYLVDDDLVLDNEVLFVNETSSLHLSGTIKELSKFSGNVDLGKMPKADNEIIFVGSKNDYYIAYQSSEILGAKFEIENPYNYGVRAGSYKIVGIKYSEESNGYGQYFFYTPDSIFSIVKKFADERYSSFELLLSGKIYKPEYWNSYMKIEFNDNVPKGKAYVSTDMNYECSGGTCISKTLNITNNNIYYEKNIDVKITKSYTKNTFTSLTGLKGYNENNGKIYINPEDYESLFNRSNFQSSVFVKNIKLIDKTNLELENLGFKTLLVKDTLVNWNEGTSQALRIIQLVVTIVLIIVMFFISYFIIKVILKSRNIYFTTIRILGASKKESKQLLDIELLTITNITYFLLIGFLLLVNYNIINLSYIKDLMTYIRIMDYVIVYLILIFMTQLISSKFAKSLFKKSAMKTFNEVV
ncbi:MAG: ABC transporter ATP-binding protein [Bacilli bacterium]|nr:ABC transporter ATP-binding protein [Bacilli bacterium]